MVLFLLASQLQLTGRLLTCLIELHLLEFVWGTFFCEVHWGAIFKKYKVSHFSWQLYLISAVKCYSKYCNQTSYILFFFCHKAPLPSDGGWRICCYRFLKIICPAKTLKHRTYCYSFKCNSILIFSVICNPGLLLKTAWAACGLLSARDADTAFYESCIDLVMLFCKPVTICH